MEYNVFKDKAIINIIPLFTGLYIAYNTSLRLIPVLLTLSVLLFYLLVTALTKKIIKDGNNNKVTEKEVFEKLVQERYKTINTFIAFGQIILLIVTLILLYQFKNNFITFLLFWLLIIGFIYNLLSLFINHWEIIKKFSKFGFF
jgi:hypothetical protein